MSTNTYQKQKNQDFILQFNLDIKMDKQLKNDYLAIIQNPNVVESQRIKLNNIIQSFGTKYDQIQSQYSGSDNEQRYLRKIQILKALPNTSQGFEQLFLNWYRFHQEKIKEKKKDPSKTQQQAKKQAYEFNWTQAFEKSEQGEDESEFYTDLQDTLMAEMKFSFYFPTKVRVVLNQVNSLDMKNNIANVNMDIEVKIKLMNPIFLNIFLNKMAKRLKLRIYSHEASKVISLESASLNDELADISYWDDIEKYETDILKSTPEQVQNNADFQGYIFYVKLPQLNLSFEPYCENPPFDMIDINFSVNFSEVNMIKEEWHEWNTYLKDSDIKVPWCKYVFKCNLVDASAEDEEKNIQEQKNNDFLNTSRKCISIEDYFLASKQLLKIQFTEKISDSIDVKLLPPNIFAYCSKGKWIEWSWDENGNENSQEKKFNNYIRYHIPFYKKPDKPFLMIVCPTFLISVVSLGVFYQDEGLNDRVANIGMVLLGLFGIFYLIKDFIKKGGVCFIFWTVLMTVVPIFGIIQTFLIQTSILNLDDHLSEEEEKSEIKYILEQNNYWFWISSAIVILYFFYAFSTFVLYCIRKGKMCQEKLITESEDKYYPGYKHNKGQAKAKGQAKTKGQAKAKGQTQGTFRTLSYSQDNIHSWSQFCKDFIYGTYHQKIQEILDKKGTSKLIPYFGKMIQILQQERVIRHILQKRIKTEEDSRQLAMVKEQGYRVGLTDGFNLSIQSLNKHIQYQCRGYQESIQYHMLQWQKNEKQNKRKSYMEQYTNGFNKGFNIGRQK